MAARPSILMALFAVLLPAAQTPAQLDAAAPSGELVRRALANELNAAQNAAQHPMRYVLRKSSPRLTTTKLVCETRDGAVARLVLVNDRPLNADDARKEKLRIDALLADPGKQHHRKQQEANDSGRALKVLRVLPEAFLYQYAGPGTGPFGAVERFSFKPNPAFNPPDLETGALRSMTGEIWVDPAQQRVVRLRGQLTEDIDIGWGLVGRVYKGGWIQIDQAPVAGNQWRIARFQMVMAGRILFRSRSFDTTEETFHFEPVSGSLNYVQALQMLQSSAIPAAGGR